MCNENLRQQISDGFTLLYLYIWRDSGIDVFYAYEILRARSLFNSLYDADFIYDYDKNECFRRVYGDLISIKNAICSVRTNTFYDLLNKLIFSMLSIPCFASSNQADCAEPSEMIVEDSSVELSDI